MAQVIVYFILGLVVAMVEMSIIILKYERAKIAHETNETFFISVLTIVVIWPFVVMAWLCDVLRFCFEGKWR